MVFKIPPAALLSALIPLLGLPPAFASSDPPLLRVGFVVPLSGPAAAYGIASKNGFEMALQERGEKRIAVNYEDDQFSCPRTVSAVKKLMEIDQVDLLVTLGSTCSNAAAPLAEKARVPMFAWAGDPAVGRGRRFVVLSGQSAELEGESLAREALRRGYGRIALLVASGDYQHTIHTGFRRVYPADLIALEEELPRENPDFHAVLLRARARNISAFALCFHPGQHALFARQARQLGMRAALFGCDNMQSSEETAASDGALDGAWLVCQGAGDEFRERYRARFGNDSVIAGAAIHYDIAGILSALLDRGITRENLVELVAHSGEQDGASGRFRLVRAGGEQHLDIPLAVMEITPQGLKRLR